LNQQSRARESYNAKYGPKADQMKERSYKTREFFEKIFKAPLNFTRTHWKGNQLVITYGAPYDIEPDSLEAEIIAFYFKDAVIKGDLIQLPYRSL
jgi:hypothetical protein